jgi:hypothetical protein
MVAAVARDFFFVSNQATGGIGDKPRPDDMIESV